MPGEQATNQQNSRQGSIMYRNIDASGDDVEARGLIGVVAASSQMNRKDWLNNT